MNPTFRLAQWQNEPRTKGRIRELLVLGRSAWLFSGLPRPVYRSGRSGLRSSVIADLSRLLALFVRCKPAICRRSAKDSRMRPVSTPLFFGLFLGCIHLEVFAIFLLIQLTKVPGSVKSWSVTWCQKQKQVN